MNKYLLLLAFVTFARSVSPAGVCTPDINRWGYSSACTCEAGYKYDQKIGKCRR